jgi:hypothetical protein
LISNTALIYAAVDALQIPLEVGSSTIEGKITKIVQVGPLKMAFPMRVKSDYVSELGAGLFVHIRGHLWGYLMIDGMDIEMALFNGGTKDFPDFRTGAMKTTISKLEKKIIADLAFVDNKWTVLERIKGG